MAEENKYIIIGGVKILITFPNKKWVNNFWRKFKYFETHDKKFELKVILKIGREKAINYKLKENLIRITIPNSLRFFKRVNFYFKTAFSDYLLITKRGFLVHSSAFSYASNAYLFTGKQTAGKSTIIQLVKKKKGLKVLNDDFSIITKNSGKYWLHGSPFFETNPVKTNAQKFKLRSIFFLNKSDTDKLEEINKKEAVVKFSSLVLSSISLENVKSPHKGKYFSLLLAESQNLVDTIPSFRLYFRKSASFLKLIVD